MSTVAPPDAGSRSRRRDAAVGDLASLARAHGWRNAIDVQCAGLDQLERYASDPREGDCLHLLPPVRGRRAVFVGNALAILPVLLADLFETVVMVDWSGVRLAFARERLEQEQVKNVTLLQADWLGAIAECDGAVDALILGEEDPEAPSSMPLASPATPARLATLIAPGGCLMYGVRFRAGAALAAPVRQRLRPDTPAFYPAHARSLAVAQCHQVTAYWRRPNLRPFHAYIPLDSPAVAEFWLEQTPWAGSLRNRLYRTLTRAAHRTGLLGAVVNNFLVVARRA